ncbi:toxin-antitoxin system TumE family protein [Paenibacillus sp. MMO-58]|uniref:toxin-antitoxin system TumE family protein n=1 Tax=Paenibacillus sp. MMO-58 TaxID=3081290 RepID=UPI0030194BD9
MSLGIPKSNFLFIETNFKDIIEEVREGVNGLSSQAGLIRKTIVFRDMSKMLCTEVLDPTRACIELYWYDWYGSNKKEIMKFHAHYHPDGTPVEITKFDPYHMHVDEKRLHSGSFKELALILEFIRLRQASLR